MADKLSVEFKRVGVSFRLEDITGPGTNGKRFYRARVRSEVGPMSVSYLLTLSELSALHAAITQELFRQRANLSRRSDGIFDPLR